MLAAPLLRRSGAASPILAAGASIVLGVAIIGLVKVDPRIGAAAIESNRKDYIFMLVCELPVFVFALISWKRFKWAFWLGWAVNAAFSLFALAIIVWLEFFWHW